jgi:tetratricopeptide (TPR) repeat protein
VLTDILPDPDQFFQALQPLLEAGEPCALVHYLREHYTLKQLCRILLTPSADVRKVAALCLGLVGDSSCISCLVEVLSDDDIVVNQMAEHALWNVWFRAAPRAATELLAQGTRAMNDQEYEQAIDYFNQSISIFPSFAEAYHQRGMTYHLMDRHQSAIEDYAKTIALMPSHFCAWAGLGHCHAYLRQIQQALEAYERAREINPHIEGVREAIGNLRRLAERDK